MADEEVGNLKRKKRQKAEKNPKRVKTTSKKKPGFDEDIYKETEYFIKDGLRYVKPYFFTFTTYCKGRWLRRKLIDVLAEEFQSETVQYYSKAIKNGNITVNGDPATEDLILKDNDKISHRLHRHEPPVTAEPITIIKETEDIVIVNKPSSIPIHPCGRYRHNTLVFLLGREFGLTNLYTIHRLDRLTSGIVMFAKSLEKAQVLEKQLRHRELKKEYVCKVRGEFPSGVVDCNQPIAVVSHKIGVCRVHPEGKPCRTIFTREHYDGTNSIVKCQPFTGRMHQIRVHLQWLGRPIVDDPLYNHEAWGPARGCGGVEDEEALKVIESIATALRNNDAGVDSTQHDAAVAESVNTCGDGVSKRSGSSKREHESNLDNQPNPKKIKQNQVGVTTCPGAEGITDKESCDDLEQENFSVPGKCCAGASLVAQNEQTFAVVVEKGISQNATSTAQDRKETSCVARVEQDAPDRLQQCVENTFIDVVNHNKKSETYEDSKKKADCCKADILEMGKDTPDKPQQSSKALFSLANPDQKSKMGGFSEKVNVSHKQIPVSTSDETKRCDENAVKTQSNFPNPSVEQNVSRVSTGSKKTHDILDEAEKELDTNEDTNDEWKGYKVADCTECQIRRRDPTPQELRMCLHAAVYKGPDWEFKSPRPSWALPQKETGI